MRDLEKTRQYFANDKYAKLSGFYVEAADVHYAKCSVKLNENHFNAVGGVMGGVIFTLADFTFAVASNNEDVHTVTVTSQITYVGRAKGESLICETRLIKDGRTTCTYELTVTDNIGTLVAIVVTNGMKV